MDEPDGVLSRLAWMAVGQLDRVIGTRAGRSIGAVIVRASSRSRSGYIRATYRLVERGDIAPSVVRLPTRWWRKRSTIAVTRLGMRFVLDLRDNLQRILYFTGRYEPEVLNRIRASLEPGDVFVDFGAHIGVHALGVAQTLQKLGGGQVYAFEPNEQAAELLDRNAAQNQLDVEVVRLALTDSEGELTLRSDARYDAADLGVVSAFGSGDELTRAKATTFDAWTKSAGVARVDIVKLDIEGSELAALLGMVRTLRAIRPRLIIVETKELSLARAGVTRDEIHTFLVSHGYRYEETVPFSNDIFVSA